MPKSRFQSEKLFLIQNWKLETQRIQPMVEESYVRNIGVRLVLECLDNSNVVINPLLKQAGLQLCDVYKENGWVPFYAHARFFDLAAQALNDPYFALKLARSIDPRDFGAVVYMGTCSKTLGDALLNLKQYIRIVTGAWKMEVVVQDENVALEFIPDETNFFDYQPATEWFVANLIHCYQFFIARDLPPREVHFVPQLGSGKNLDDYEKLLGCKVCFGQRHCQVIISREDMKLPIRNFDERLLGILKSHCDQLLREHELVQSVFLRDIRKHIIDRLPGGGAKAKNIAIEMGITERTMSRRLLDEDTNFSEILETLRHNLAMTYIQDKKLSLKQISYLLGYGNQSAFSVAFKRWRGCTPKEARNAL